MVSTSEKNYVIFASNIQKLEEIAKGGFGVVYKGLMQGNIEVAIKELYNQSISQTAQEDMEKEILMQLKTPHPNMVSLYGFCPAPLCLVMEFLPYNLLDLLQNQQDLPWDLCYQISLDIVLGLEYIHEKNIVHRDLKSSNILLDNKLKAKITDFGL